jgi:phenylacetate-CoA ligase
MGVAAPGGSGCPATVSRLLGLYHLLPPALRPAAASLRGWYLQRWRYGPETELLVDRILQRETWSAEQWRIWQEQRLAEILHRAATRVPYYREHWARRRRDGDRAAWDLLANWPILSKEALRASPRAFLADDCQPDRMYVEHTSGTTGTPLTLWFSRSTLRDWYALFEARCRRWHGVTRKDRWAILGGQLVVPVEQRRPPYWVWNAPMRQLYMSSYHLAPENLSYYHEALRRYRIRYLYGYTSALDALARGGPIVPDRGGPEVAFTNAEPLLAHQRARIAARFGCPVRETYGMTEAVVGAGECKAGALHLWPEAGQVEFSDGEPPRGADTGGELICTGLLNADMPLIRYRVGDRAVPAPDTGRCGCGRSLPRLAAVEGRVEDVLYTVDGRPVGRLDPVFKGDIHVGEAQIIQESFQLVRVRFVRAPGFDDSDAKAITDGIRARMGDITVQLEEVPAIARSANGKMRAVVCRIPPEQRPEPR